MSSYQFCPLNMIASILEVMEIAAEKMDYKAQ
jgi:hypothetical protein